jgi:hypothetical protein
MRHDVAPPPLIFQLGIIFQRSILDKNSTIHLAKQSHQCAAKACLVRCVEKSPAHDSSCHRYRLEMLSALQHSPLLSLYKNSIVILLCISLHIFSGLLAYPVQGLSKW